MSLSETIVKVIFWPRIRKAKKIGEAAALIGEGRAEETLRILATMERRIPPYLGHLFFVTRARALDALGRLDEAEQSYLAAVFAKEGSSIAFLHLAVLCGRLRRFDDARAWIRRLREDPQAEAALLEQAVDLEGMLGDLESGRRLEEMRARARRFEEKRGLVGAGVEAALEELDRWVDAHPDEARAECDELACYLGELAAGGEPGPWSVTLAIEDTTVAVKRCGEERSFSPFGLVRSRLGGEATLAELFFGS